MKIIEDLNNLDNFVKLVGKYIMHNNSVYKFIKFDCSSISNVENNEYVIFLLELKTNKTIGLADEHIIQFFKEVQYIY